MLPVNVPAVVSGAVRMETVMVAGVLVALAAALSQLPPVCVLLDSVNPAGELVVNCTVCGVGAVPPIWYVKLSDVGLAVRVCCATIAIVTGTVSGVLDAVGTWIVIVPVHVVPAAADTASGTTEMVAGVVPLVVPRVSQLPQVEVLAAEAVNATAVAVPLALTDRVCEAAAAPPCTCVKLSEVGETAAVMPVLAVTVSVTCTVSGEFETPEA
jgi:hypothetical protein